jgi:hypothetical protein
MSYTPYVKNISNDSILDEFEEEIKDIIETYEHTDVVTDSILLDADNTDCLLVRKNNDSLDILRVDTNLSQTVFNNGTTARPSVAFTGSTTSGLAYSSGLSLVHGGSERMKITSSIQPKVQILAYENSSETDCQYSSELDNTSGLALYDSGTGNTSVNMVNLGTPYVQAKDDSGSKYIQLNESIRTDDAYQLGWYHDLATQTINSRLYCNGGANLTLESLRSSAAITFNAHSAIYGFINSSLKLSLLSSEIRFGDSCRAVIGSEGTPAYSFSSDTNTGIYRIGSDNLGVTCGGKNVLDVQQSKVTVTSTEFVHRPLTTLSTNTDFRIQVGDGIGSYADIVQIDEVAATFNVPILFPDATSSISNYHETSHTWSLRNSNNTDEFLTIASTIDLYLTRVGNITTLSFTSEPSGTVKNVTSFCYVQGTIDSIFRPISTFNGFMTIQFGGVYQQAAVVVTSSGLIEIYMDAARDVWSANPVHFRRSAITYHN